MEFLKYNPFLTKGLDTKFIRGFQSLLLDKYGCDERIEIEI